METTWTSVGSDAFRITICMYGLGEAQVIIAVGPRLPVVPFTFKILCRSLSNVLMFAIPLTFFEDNS